MSRKLTIGHGIALAILATIGLPNAGLAQGVKIVGIGSGSCKQFLEEINGNRDVERNYFAWAQGYMNGILLRAPAGVDEDLDLTPPTFPIAKQAQYLRMFCANQMDKDFADGVQELYKALRNRSS